MQNKFSSEPFSLAQTLPGPRGGQELWMSMPGLVQPLPWPLCFTQPPAISVAPVRGDAGAQQPCVYFVAVVLRLRVLLKRGWSRKSRKGLRGAPSSSSTVMLLGRPACSTEPGTKRVCWGPRRGQYRPRLKPFIHSWPWKMEMGLSCAPLHPCPLSRLCTVLPCSNLGTSQRCPR